MTPPPLRDAREAIDMPRAKRSASEPSDATRAIVDARAPKRSRTREDDARDDGAALDGAISLRAAGRKKNAAPTRTSALAAPIMALTRGHEGGVNAVAFSRSGATLASAGHDGGLALWRAGDASASANFMTARGCKNAVTDACYTMDDECAVTSDADGVVRVWDAETGGQVKSYASTRGKCANAVSAARGDLVMSASDDGSACVWDLRVKKRAARTYAHAVPQTACVMSAHGDRAYVGGVDDVVRAWDARMENKPLMTLEGHEDTITGLDISPCGSFVLSNSMDNTLRMWDTRAFVEGERETKRFVGHSHNFEKALLRCAFNADGTRVGSGSADSCVYVWEVENAKLKYKLPGHKGVVSGVAFSPAENPVIASGGADGVVFVGELDR